MSYLNFIYSNGERAFAGTTGTPTKFKDKDGNQLYVGDIVTLPSGDTSIVVETEIPRLGRVKQYISGIEKLCNDYDGEISLITVRKKLSHWNLVNDEIYDNYYEFIYETED